MSRSMEWPVSSVVPLSGTEGRTHSDCSWESVCHHWHLPKARIDYSSRSIGLQHSSHSEREASRRCLNGTVSIQQEARAPRDGQRLQKGLSPPLEAPSVPQHQVLVLMWYHLVRDSPGWEEDLNWLGCDLDLLLWSNNFRHGGMVSGMCGAVCRGWDLGKAGPLQVFRAGNAQSLWNLLLTTEFHVNGTQHYGLQNPTWKQGGVDGKLPEGFASGSTFLFPSHFHNIWSHYAVSFDQVAPLSSLLIWNWETLRMCS